MKSPLADVLATLPAQQSVIRWGVLRLSVMLFRDMENLASRVSEANRFAYMVDPELGEFITTEAVGLALLGDEFRPARTVDSRIGSYGGADMFVCSAKPPKGEHFLAILCLDDNGDVVHVATTQIKPIPMHVNMVPEVTRSNVRALNGDFSG